MLGKLDNILHVSQHGLRTLRNLPPERSQYHLAAAALDELHAKPLFELAQLAAERGLADVAHLGGTPEVQGFGDCDQVAKLLKGGHESSQS